MTCSPSVRRQPWPCCHHPSPRLPCVCPQELYTLQSRSVHITDRILYSAMSKPCKEQPSAPHIPGRRIPSSFAPAARSALAVLMRIPASSQYSCPSAGLDPSTHPFILSALVSAQRRNRARAFHGSMASTEHPSSVPRKLRACAWPAAVNDCTERTFVGMTHARVQRHSDSVSFSRPNRSRRLYYYGRQRRIWTRACLLPQCKTPSATRAPASRRGSLARPRPRKQRTKCGGRRQRSPPSPRSVSPQCMSCHPRDADQRVRHIHYIQRCVQYPRRLRNNGMGF